MVRHSEGKLCTYSTFKCNFGLEKYLFLLNNFEQRRNLTKFRISAHRLHIERGRYQGTPRHNRTCLRCSSNEVDDEGHFLFSCNSSEEERDILNEIINQSCPNFSRLDADNKLIWLMNTEDVHILSQICSLIKKSGI